MEKQTDRQLQIKKRKTGWSNNWKREKLGTWNFIVKSNFHLITSLRKGSKSIFRNNLYNRKFC